MSQYSPELSPNVGFSREKARLAAVENSCTMKTFGSNSPHWEYRCVLPPPIKAVHYRIRIRPFRPTRSWVEERKRKASNTSTSEAEGLRLVILQELKNHAAFNAAEGTLRLV